MVACHRNSGGLRGVGSIRPVRRAGDTQCAVGRSTFSLVAGIRCDPGCGVLGAASCFRSSYLGGRYRDHWRRSSHSACLPTEATSDGLSSGTRRSQRRRRRQSTVGHSRNPAEYDLLFQHLSCGGHGNRRPACGRYYRRHLRGARLLSQGGGLPCSSPYPRRLRLPISPFCWGCFSCRA